MVGTVTLKHKLINLAMQGAVKCTETTLHDKNGLFYNDLEGTASCMLLFVINKLYQVKENIVYCEHLCST